MSPTPPDRPREPLETSSYGGGYLAPANEHQSRDIILFDRKKPPRDEEGHPIFGVIFGSEVPVCASKKRNRDAYCGHDGRMENGRCKYHGGKSLKGWASPTWKNGRRS